MAAQVEAWGSNTLGGPQSSLKSIDDVNKTLPKVMPKDLPKIMKLAGELES